MVGFILACLGHRYRAVAGSNPALPTKKNLSGSFCAYFRYSTTIKLCK